MAIWPWGATFWVLAGIRGWNIGFVTIKDFFPVFRLRKLPALEHVHID